MNAESLVDKGLGLIREISEQNAENSSVFSLSKKIVMLNACVPSFR